MIVVAVACLVSGDAEARTVVAGPALTGLVLFAVVLLGLTAWWVRKAVGEGIEAAVPVAGASSGRDAVLGSTVGVCMFERSVGVVLVSDVAWGVVRVVAAGRAAGVAGARVVVVE